MIYFVSLQDHFNPIRRLLAGIKPELKTLRHISYERLFHFRLSSPDHRGQQAPVGHYVFTDLDRLSHYEREAAIALTDALREVDPALRILNDPRNVLDRYPLLRLLEQRGLNRFSVTRLDDGTRPERYPVFVRCEDDHKGADTELLHSAEELERAISELRAQGRVLKRRIAVEFCAKKDDAGLYRKYGAFNVDGRIIPQHILHSEHWQIKTRTRRENELLDEELSFIRENPHRERVAQCFSLAHIDFGRADYGFVDGEMQMYEINTNPNPPGLKERPDGRNERRRIIRQQMVDAFRTIDVPLPDAPPVRFSLPSPVYHRMRPWRPVRTSIAHLLKAYPQVRWLIPGRFL